MSYDCYRNAAKCCDSTYYRLIITKVSVTMKFKKIFSYFFYVICGVRSFTASCYFDLFPYIIFIIQIIISLSLLFFFSIYLFEIYIIKIIKILLHNIRITPVCIHIFFSFCISSTALMYIKQIRKCLLKLISFNNRIHKAML